jgi:hypothetical protein
MRKFIGAILSVVKGAQVELSTFSPNMQLDTIMEDKDEGPLPEDGIDDGLGAYPGSPSKGGETEPPMTRSHPPARRDNAESGLMVCPVVGRYLLPG